MRVRNHRLQPTAAAIQPYSSTPAWQHRAAWGQKSTLGHCSRVPWSWWWVAKDELSLLFASAKQAKRKEAKIRLRTRAARGAEARCFVLQREASVCTIPAEVCWVFCAMCPAWPRPAGA